MLAWSIYNKCSHHQSYLITPGQSVNLPIQGDMVSLDCEHSWLLTNKKKYWTILIPELILDAQVRIYLEKKIALGINLTFCLILPKKNA